MPQVCVGVIVYLRSSPARAAIAPPPFQPIRQGNFRKGLPTGPRQSGVEYMTDLRALLDWHIDRFTRFIGSVESDKLSCDRRGNTGVERASKTGFRCGARVRTHLMPQDGNARRTGHKNGA